MIATGSPLRSRNFRLLVTGATINAFGGALTPVAIAFAVLDLGGSATDLGIVVGALALAEVLSTLFGGVLGDRLPRQWLLEGSSIVSGAIRAVMAASLIGGWSSIPLLAVLSFAAGLVASLAGPSSSALTPMTVSPHQLTAAVSVRRIGNNVATVIGFGIAGVLVTLVGTGGTIAIDAATYAVAAGCFAMLRLPRAFAERGRSLLADFGGGLREVFRHSWLWVLIGQAMLYHLFYGGAQGVLGPIVIADRFGRTDWGLAMSSLMLGFVVGGLCTLRWRPRRALMTGTFCLALTACFPLAMAWSPTAAGVFAGAFLHGFGLEVFSVWWDLSILQNVPEGTLARVYSFDIVGSFVARPIGLVLTGPVAAVVGQSRWLVLVAAIMAGSSLYAATIPDVRRLRRRDEGSRAVDEQATSGPGIGAVGVDPPPAQ